MQCSLNAPAILHAPQLASAIKRAGNEDGAIGAKLNPDNLRGVSANKRCGVREVWADIG